MLFFSCPVVSDSLQPSGLQHASLPVPHRLPVFAQVPVHCISDAIQPSHPLVPSPLSAVDLSQHQGLFHSQLFTSDDYNTSASASVLPVNIQG